MYVWVDVYINLKEHTQKAERERDDDDDDETRVKLSKCQITTSLHPQMDQLALPVRSLHRTPHPVVW